MKRPAERSGSPEPRQRRAALGDSLDLGRSQVIRPPIPSNRMPLRVPGAALNADENRDSFEVSAGEMRFVVIQGQSTRWQNFRTDRRVYRVRFHGGGQPQDHLLRNVVLQELLVNVLKKVLQHIRMLHHRAGRPDHALMMLSLQAFGLAYPIVVSASSLMEDTAIYDLLARLTRALSSKTTIRLDEEFRLEASFFYNACLMIGDELLLLVSG